MKRILFAFLFLFSFILTAGAQEQSGTYEMPGGTMTVKPPTTPEKEPMPISPIPEKIIFARMELSYLQETLQQLQAGTHPALKELEKMMDKAKENLELAQKNVQKVEVGLPTAWRSLAVTAQEAIMEKLLADPDVNAWDLRDYSGNLDLSTFNSLIVEIKRHIPVLKECQSIQKECEVLLNSDMKKALIESLSAQVTQKNEFIQNETEKFKKSLLLDLLESAPGYKDSTAKFPFEYLYERIGNMERYDFGWKSKSLLEDAEKLWDERSGAKKKDNTVTGGTGGNDSGDGAVAPPEGRTAGERMVKTVDGIEYVFRWCPAGTFTMGDSDCYQADPHSVTLTRGFWMLETEVTQAMWKSVMGTTVRQQRDKEDPDWRLKGEGADYPIYYVNWEESRTFCKKLSSKLGVQVSLPTEAQWEYACRAGTTGAYAGDLDAMGWYYGNSGSKTHPVGQKKANEWGLKDMHGNVWEWCSDWYGKDYYTESPTSDPKGPDSGSYRVYRGGSWNGSAEDCRSAYRVCGGPGNRHSDLGFRIVLADPAPGK